MMMSAVSQFDGASLFAGSSFMPSESTQAPEPSAFPTRSHWPQTLLPLTVKQIAESCFSGDDSSGLFVNGLEVNFKVLGVVVDKVERVTDASFLIDDGTGRIEIGRWISVPSDSAEVAAVEIGMYVQVNGHMKEFQGKRHAFAFSIRPVVDFNDISLHFIDCIYLHMVNPRLKGGAPNAIQMNPAISAPFSNGVRGYQAPLYNQFLGHSGGNGTENEIMMTVLGVFQEPSALAREYGLHVDELFRRLGLPKNKIMEAVDYLVNVGHIYSTIDEYHFKSAGNGYQ